MVETCSRFTIERLFCRVMRTPHRFRVLVVASPFIDRLGIEMLTAVDRAPCEFVIRVLTRPSTAAVLNAREWRRTSVRGVEGLHAKLYAALGISSSEHEMVITSANLTDAGLHNNIEMGMRITGSNRQLATMVEQVVKWSTTTMATVPPVTRPECESN